MRGSRRPWSGRCTEVASEIGEVEVLIYNARGEFARRDPLDMTYAELEEIYRVEVVGAFAAARAVLPAMRRRGAGSVIFSSATAAFRGSATHPLYAIGKFGLRALSQMSGQGVLEGRGARGAHEAGLRPGRADDARALRRRPGEDAHLADPDAVAESYWWAHRQPKSAWSNEIELRPHTEKWTW